MKKYLLILLMFLPVLIMFGQYDEVRILLNQARSFENRNQFTQALDIYQNLYKKFPGSESIIEPYLRVLYINSDLTTAERILSESRAKVSAYFFESQYTQLLIKQNNIRDAERNTFLWFDKHPGQINHYREFARLFETSFLFDTAISIYLRARDVTKDTNLFALELSNAYFAIRNSEKFFEESIKFLRRNSGYLYFFKNRFTELLNDNNDNIKLIERFINPDKEPEQVIELYAFSLVDVQEFQKAGEIYSLLPVSKIVKFADDLKSLGNIDFALNTYYLAIDKVNQENKPEKHVQIADIQMKIANIYFENNQMDKCKSILQKVINNNEIQKSPWNFRTQANKESRLLMALILIFESHSALEDTFSIDNKRLNEIKNWFNQASRFAYNQNERAEIQFQMARYLYLLEKYDEASSSIISAIQNQDPSTNIYKLSYFYRYEMALFQTNPDKDSLLVECLIHFPHDNRINNMLFFETFLNNMSYENQRKVVTALRYKGLFLTEKAIYELFKLAFETNIDELYILACDWAVNNGIDIFNNNVKINGQNINEYTIHNPVLRDYFSLLSTRNIEDFNNKQKAIKDFLSNNPQNAFSPQFRYLLMRIQNT